MRNSENSQILESVEDFEETIQPLELKSDKSAQLAVHFNVADAQIAILTDECMALKCEPADKKAFELVHSRRMDVADLRIQVEKTRVGLNAEAIARQRAVNGEAKRITALLEPVESHLKAQEAIYTAEQDRIKAERQKEAQARIQVRIDALAAVGVTANLAEIALMSEEAFQRHLSLETESFARAEAIKAEAKAKAEAEEAERVARVRAETERLEAMRKEQAEAQAKLDTQAAQLKAQSDAMEAKQKAIDQAAREEQIRKDAEAKAKADAEQAENEREEKRRRDAEAKVIEQERQAKAAAEAKAAEEAKAKAVAAARPDAEKLFQLAMEIDVFNYPDMATDAGKAIVASVKVLAQKMADYTRSKAEGLTK